MPSQRVDWRPESPSGSIFSRTTSYNLPERRSFQLSIDKTVDSGKTSRHCWTILLWGERALDMTGVPSQAVRLQLLCLLLCQTLQVFCTEFTHDRKRLGPLESVRAEHGCLEKFEVRENTIIRTEVSRGLGAKFLVESDVGNREDCLTYCCQTHLCNVAVFEEKVRDSLVDLL